MQPKVSTEAWGPRPKREARQEEGVAAAWQQPSCQGHTTEGRSCRGSRGAGHTGGKPAEARTSQAAGARQTKSTRPGCWETSPKRRGGWEGTQGTSRRTLQETCWTHRGGSGDWGRQGELPRGGQRSQPLLKVRSQEEAHMTRHWLLQQVRLRHRKERNAFRWKLKSKPSGIRDSTYVRLEEHSKTGPDAPAHMQLLSRCRLTRDARQSSTDPTAGKTQIPDYPRKLESTSDRAVPCIYETAHNA